MNFSSFLGLLVFAVVLGRTMSVAITGIFTLFYDTR